MLYVSSQYLLHLFTWITTAIASCISPMTSPTLDGLHHLRTWITPIMVIQMLDTLLLLLASTTLLSHWWTSSNSKLHPANCHYALIYSFGGTSTQRSMVCHMDVRMMTLERNYIRKSPHPFHLSWYLPPYQMASNLCTSFTPMVQTPRYWPVLWFSLGTVCAPISPVHQTVTFSNPTLVSNTLSMESNTCANSPHLIKPPATASKIAFIIAYPIGTIGMPLMLASRQWHHSWSLILYMIAFAKSVTQILIYSNPINLQHLQHISKLLPIGLLARGCPNMPNGVAPWMLIRNSCLFDNLLTILCWSKTNLCVPSTTSSIRLCSIHSLW